MVSAVSRRLFTVRLKGARPPDAALYDASRGDGLLLSRWHFVVAADRRGAGSCERLCGGAMHWLPLPRLAVLCTTQK